MFGLLVLRNMFRHKLRTALGYDLPDWRADVLPTIEALVPELAP